MKNRLLKFDEFKNGNTLVEPKKHALAVKPADPVKREKTIDQVKKADLTPLDTNEPDYSKTVKVDEAKKVKFVLYTNPGNSTSAGYVAIGTEDVREVLSDAKRYSDSYKILYQGSGTQADLVKAKNMFSDYSFGNKSIDESILDAEAIAIQVEADKINIELKKLDPKAADYDTKKLDLDTKLLAIATKQKVTAAAPKAV
jgi:hypothetical protein